MVKFWFSDGTALVQSVVWPGGCWFSVCSSGDSERWGLMLCGSVVVQILFMRLWPHFRWFSLGSSCVDVVPQ